MFISAHRYQANTENYLKTVALKRMPANLQTVDMLKAGKNLFLYSACYESKWWWHLLIDQILNNDWIPVPEPCLDSFVFLRVKERQENIFVEPETDDQR